VVEARDTETVVTGRGTGAPCRVLKNKMSTEYLRLTKEGVPLEELEKLTLGSLRRAVFQGDLDTGSFMAGQIAGMVKSVRPVFDHVNDYKETLEIL
jgi:enoyl-[acyl-carrier protein] reductase II